MEKQVKITAEGDEAQLNDFNRLGEAAGLADDRVLAELFRFQPQGTLQKVIIPQGTSDWSAPSTLHSTALVQGNTADATIRVLPFRAIVSSLDTSSELEVVRGSRSAIHVGGSNVWSQHAVAANVSANPRITLVYVALTPNANGVTESRYNRDPSSQIITSNARVTYTTTTVAIGLVDGATGVTPARPTPPLDAAGTYYISLAFLWVPAGFGALSIVNRQQIEEVAPCISLHSSTGAITSAPANQQYAVNGSVDTHQTDSTQQYRNGAYTPSTAVGGAVRWIKIQLSVTPLSHASGDLVDNSIDWRFRMFKWDAFIKGGTTAAAGFASDRRTTGVLPSPNTRGVTGVSQDSGWGQSFIDDTNEVVFPSPPAGAHGRACMLDATRVSNLGTPGSTYLMLYVDSVGALRVAMSASAPIGQIVIRLEASGPESNFGTV